MKDIGGGSISMIEHNQTVSTDSVAIGGQVKENSLAHMDQLSDKSPRNMFGGQLSLEPSLSNALQMNKPADMTAPLLKYEDMFKSEPASMLLD